MDTLASRLSAAVDHAIKVGALKSQNDLARKISVSRQCISSIKQGRGGGGRRVMERIAAVLGCSLEWLERGEGARPGWAAAPVAASTASPTIAAAVASAPVAAPPAGSVLERVNLMEAEMAMVRRQLATCLQTLGLAVETPDVTPAPSTASYRIGQHSQKLGKR